MKTRAKRGFTLVEILIVVVILGILAAIVIPQFSQASTDAKVNSLMSDLQTMRSQISLYKIQHNDAPPAVTATTTTWDEMTQYTDVDGNISTTKTTVYCYGPYLLAVPVNPFTGTNPPTVGGATTFDWNYTVADGTIHAGADTTADSAAHQLY